MRRKTKPAGRKRKIVLTIALSLSLLFGKARVSSSPSRSSKFNNQEVHQRLINDRELSIIRDNSCQGILAKAEIKNIC